MDPLRFVVALHFHQPVGNFDEVFAQHAADVYRPLLAHLRERSFFPVVLHVSGPLLDWLARHDPAYVDELAALAADGRLELLLAGYDEPVLAALPREDRREQLRRMHAALRARFGVDARALWLTERVWEPDLAADLAEAGVRAVLLDDRHFLVSGVERERLHTHYLTEHDGRRVAVVPIDQRLRYLIPFRAPHECADHLRHLHAEGHRLAVFGDDAEKLGGWPGTKEWVYERGWLRQFMEQIERLVGEGVVRLATVAEALDAVPGGGLAYLPSASYREMEAWALPTPAALRLRRLGDELGEHRLDGPDGALVRGGHWRHFLVKYPEANRMHKAMLALSALCRERGDPPEARRAIGRAQCNDAYWHGVFGGLYLPHLREAVWRNLAEAEGRLRAGEPLAAERRDLDADGCDEVLVHSAHFSAVVAPHRGGGIETLVPFIQGINLADTLARRREPYHEGRDVPEDADPRAIGLERILPGDLDEALHRSGRYPVLASWARSPLTARLHDEGERLVVELVAPDHALVKRYRFTERGLDRVELVWNPAPWPDDAVFASELSVRWPVELECEPTASVWRHHIATLAQSERGLDETVQGEAYVLRWPARLGRAAFTLRYPPG